MEKNLNKSGDTTPNGAHPPIRALIFDMDGLLVDSESQAQIAITTFVRGYGHELNEEVGARLLGRRLPDAMVILREAFSIETPVEEMTATYGEMRLAALRGTVKPMPGAAEIIAFARAAGLGIALATSGQRSHADLSLSETGLAGLFDVEATGNEVQHGKPAPDLFLLAASRIGAEPAACVVFEDSPPGIAAAVAAGMRAVAVPNENSRAMPFPTAPEVSLPSLYAAIDWLRQHGVSASDATE